MSNSWFQFKQFRIAQEACAMKVTTDACIQGAWTQILPNVKRVLDIGTGTGLLSLMLAQCNADILIDAIELDSVAALQAKNNVASSPWKDRINVCEGDAINYSFPHKYDLIICNPPFFNNSLLSSDSLKNQAKHAISISQDELLETVGNNLNEDGYASILLPFQEYKLWKELLQQNGWEEIAMLNIRHTPTSDVKRVVSLCSKKAGGSVNNESLTIKDEDQYTAAFIDLLSPFYLNLQ